MTDPIDPTDAIDPIDPIDPTDDLLRDALRAEAADVQAGDAMLDQIHADAGRAMPGRSRRGPLLLVAAAVVAVAGIGAGLALADRDHDESLDAVDDPTPGPTVTSTPVPDPDAGATSTTACSPVANPPCGNVGAHPTLIALVRDDGWLVTVDLATGVEQELVTHGDPHDPDLSPDPELGASITTIDSLDLSPDGTWIYYSTCCEPASGMTYRVEVGHPDDDREPAFVAYGADPAVSPDGRYLATATGEHIQITDLEDLETTWTSGPVDTAHDLAWSPDGTKLAYVGFGGDGGQSHVLTWTGSGLEQDPADMGPGGDGPYVGWSDAGAPTSFGGDPIADDRSFAQDTSYHWDLWVDDAGIVRFGPFGDDDRALLPGVPKAIDADW